MKKQALLVVDVQNTIVSAKDFTETLSKINEMISLFKKNEDEIIYIQHIDYSNEDILSSIHPS